MTLLAVNELKGEVDSNIVKKVVALSDCQLDVRLTHDPISADNNITKMEERIRRTLAKKSKNDRELKRYVHVDRTGLWIYEKARNNLHNAKEILWDKKQKQWQII